MRLSPLVVILFMAPLASCAQSAPTFSLEVVPDKPSALAGTPVKLHWKLRTTSEQPIDILCGGKEYEKRIKAFAADGSSVVCATPSFGLPVPPQSLNRHNPLAFADELSCNATSVVQVEVAVEGCRWSSRQGVQWPAVPVSTQIPILQVSRMKLDFKPPVGDDLAAFTAANGFPADYGNRQMILERYPVSYYAGFALVSATPIVNLMFRNEPKSLGWIVSGEYAKLHTKVEENSSRRTDDGKPIFTPIGPAIAKRRTLIANYLKAHPDFEDRWAIERQAVLLHLAVGDYEAASRSLDWMEAHPEGRKPFELEQFTHIKTFMTGKSLYRAKK